MKHYILPSGTPPRKLPFYLAMEEWVAARCAPGEDAFFTWQVDPTVIFGRNQMIEAEVDTAYCAANGIQYYRRKSGGGCVFADRSNLMLSYITASHRPIADIFAGFTTAVAEALQSMGIDARVSGRNDITIGGRKISGNAFYRTPSGVSIVHGTMLYDSDMAHMARAITPSRSKLESKKVKSVPARITTLHEHTTLPLATVRDNIIAAMCHSSYTLTPADIAEIEAIEEPYYRDSWIKGRRRKSQALTLRHNIDGVGEFVVDIALSPDAATIADVDITGDFFLTGDIDSTIIAPLRGIRYDRPAVAEALATVDSAAVVTNLDKNQLVNIFF